MPPHQVDGVNPLEAALREFARLAGLTDDDLDAELARHKAERRR